MSEVLLALDSFLRDKEQVFTWNGIPRAERVPPFVVWNPFPLPEEPHLDSVRLVFLWHGYRFQSYLGPGTQCLRRFQKLGYPQRLTRTTKIFYPHIPWDYVTVLHQDPLAGPSFRIHQGHYTVHIHPFDVRMSILHFRDFSVPVWELLSQPVQEPKLQARALEFYNLDQRSIALLELIKAGAFELGLGGKWQEIWDEPFPLRRKKRAEELAQQVISDDRALAFLLSESERGQHV